MKAPLIVAVILAILLPHSLSAETVTFDLTKSGMEAIGYTKKRSKNSFIPMYDYTMNSGPIKLCAEKVSNVYETDIEMYVGGILTFSPNTRTRFSGINITSVAVTFDHGYNISSKKIENSEFTINFAVTDNQREIYSTSHELYPKSATITFDVDVTIGDAGYATLYLNDAAIIPDGVKAYTTTIEGDIAILHPIESNVLPAHTGVILQNQGTFTFTHSDEQSTGIGSNAMVGSTRDTTAVNFSGCLYALGIKNNTLGFYRINTDPETGETPITPYKSYLQIEGNSGKPNSLTITGDESSVISITEDLQSEDRYDLLGRRASIYPAHLIKGNVIIR